MDEVDFLTVPAVGGRVCLQSSSWLAAGVEHGFVGAAEQSEDAFPQTVIRLQQKHTSNVYDAREEAARRSWRDAASSGAELPVADAFILSRSKPHSSDKRYAIMTADCLPILIRTENFIAGVHAGWRGLAAGIIEKTMFAMGLSFDRPAAVLIGPAAGPKKYQVRADVIAALGDSARFQPEDSGTFLLDLPGTAMYRIHAAFPRADIEVLPVCTMSDSRFHSYRREGAGGGRNFCYVVAAE